jgi:hypothetical protein
MQVSDLKAVDEWAARRLASGKETPWDWYQLMKLREAIEALTRSDGVTLPAATTPQAAQRPEKRFRLVADTHSTDNAPPRSE